MANPLHSAIFSSKLEAFYAEYAERNPGSELPDINVKFSSPGLDFYFPLSVGGSFDPPAAPGVGTENKGGRNGV